MLSRIPAQWRLALTALCVVILTDVSISCDGPSAGAKEPLPTPQGREVGVVKVKRQTVQRSIVVSSELIPFQQIDVYAKESGFVRELKVDYGSRVRTGQ